MDYSVTHEEGFSPYYNLPDGLHLFKNWVHWRLEEINGRWTKVPYMASTTSLVRASSTNPETWATLREAIFGFSLRPHDRETFGLGFVLTRGTGLVCIDLDDPDKLATPELRAKAKQAHADILNEFKATYIEKSPSGKGFHIWFAGTLPENRGSVSVKDTLAIEIYSDERYLTMTGFRIEGSGTLIQNQQKELDKLLDVFRRVNGGKLPAEAIGTIDAGDIDDSLGRRSDLTDAEVLQIAIRNNSKFLEFYNARPQSDRSRFAKPVAGDLDKITGDPEQVYRIMESSPIGQTYEPSELRRKLFKYWLGEARASNKEILEKREEGRQMQAQMMEQERLREIEEQRKAAEPKKSEELKKSSAKADNWLAEHFRFIPNEISEYSTEYPPGMIGAIAREIRERATMRSSLDFSIAAALSIFAGLSGHAYSIEKVNGAFFMLLLGISGQGKEAPAEARDVLVSQLAQQGIPEDVLTGLTGPGAITSPQGLHKRMETNRTMLCILGESTIWLNDLVTARQGINMSIKASLMNLWAKMGRNRVVAPAEVMNKENKLASIVNPAVTLLMEGEPSSYYELLGDDSYTSSGLAARIIHVDTDPDDFPPKHYGETSFSEYVVKNLASMIPFWQNKRNEQIAVAASAKNGVQFGNISAESAYIRVQMTEQCQLYHFAFDNERDQFVRYFEQNNKRIADLCNRMVPNVLRIATNIAAGINPYNPVIDLPTYQWAQAFVLRGLIRVGSKVFAHETGTGDARVRSLLLEKMQRWADMMPAQRKAILLKNKTFAKRAEVVDALALARVMPYSILQSQTSTQIGRYAKDRGLLTLQNVLRDMHAAGEIIDQPNFACSPTVTFQGRVVGVAEL